MCRCVQIYNCIPVSLCPLGTLEGDLKGSRRPKSTSSGPLEAHIDGIGRQGIADQLYRVFHGLQKREFGH